MKTATGMPIAWSVAGPFALFIPYLLGHFFLFCNTFRVGGERSLIWVGTFLANAYFWPQTQTFWIHVTVTIQSLIAIGLIVHCVLGRNYQGLCCEQVNPQGFRSGALLEGAFTRRVLLGCRVPKPLIETLIGRRLDEFNDDLI